MPRPRKCRTVRNLPQVTLFKPQGVPLREMEEVSLAVEGLEALRLADLEGWGQEDAAGAMGVSRPTFSRILSRARQTVARALVQGLALRVGGGDFVLAPAPGQGPGPVRRRRRFRGGRGGV